MKNVMRKPNSSRMKIAEALAGDRAHARGDFLNHDQRQSNWN